MKNYINLMGAILLLAVCGGIFAPAPVQATGTWDNVAGVIRFDSNNDSVAPNSGNVSVAPRVLRASLIPVGAGKYYRVRAGSASGNILLEMRSNYTTSSAVSQTTDTETLEAGFNIGTSGSAPGLFFQTDDSGLDASGTSASLILFLAAKGQTQ